MRKSTTRRSRYPIFPEPDEDPVVHMAAAMSATCLTLRSGAVRCFGWAFAGVTGRGTDRDSIWAEFAASNNGSDSETLQGLRDMALGGAHGCALTSEGGAQCWGRDYRGQVGDGFRETEYRTLVSEVIEDLEQTADDPRIPRDVVGLRAGVSQVQTGGEHSCAILDNGQVRCWGSNRYGQLGFAGDYPVPEGAEQHERAPELEARPVDICLDLPATDLALGGAHSCALLTDGTVQCWGSANHGKLGNGHYTRDSLTPVTVEGLTDVVQIESRHMHTCAITSSGQLYCWGLNYYGQLGTGDATDQAIPQLVTGFLELIEVRETADQG